MDYPQAHQRTGPFPSFPCSDQAGNGVGQRGMKRLAARGPSTLRRMPDGRNSGGLLYDYHLAIEVTKNNGLVLPRLWGRPWQHLHQLAGMNPSGRIEAKLAANIDVPGFDEAAHLAPG